MKNPMRYNLATRAREQFIVESIRPKADEKAFDIGCGLGYFTSLLAERGDVYGVDIDRESLEFAHKQCGASFLLANALSLPFKNSTFDYILASEIIEHLPDEKIFLKELKRVAKKGAIIVLTTPSLDGLLQTSNICHESGTEYHYRDGYRKEELTEILESAGFEVVRIEYNMSFFTRILMEIIKFGYRAKYSSFEKQSDVLKSSNSVIFKVYKTVFPIFIVFIYIDSLLSKVIRGSNIQIKAKNP